ncbi:hypothetical protein EXIGLDRAFT_639757 [Exidia glandulosa HHB12029]|uniref:Uncharacterized protein n=1 Tax=Exidia glandulosa HHB12029 TaxID=1314781 RepID=A0A165N740_EXIGL|nr:hypothetical protein EXIGLDRAFT_639757 [Exidia glandulosa HHB12029]
MEQIEFTALLHTMANRPDKALPPGKSVLSILARSRDNPQPEDPVAARIADMMTRAFFDSAAEILASADTSAQLARLQMLYTDLHTAYTDVLPPVLPQMHTLSSPIALDPSRSPLEIGRSDLRSLLAAIRKRCARVRDAAVDTLTQLLTTAPADDVTALAKAIADAVRGLLKLAEDMKNDMLSHAAAQWREEDVRRWLREEALVNERATILSLWPVDRSRRLWEAWMAVSGTENTSKLERWVARLITAAGSNQPVSPPPLQPTEEADATLNVLPPYFVFCIPELVRVQNLVQALVITAALRSLVPTASSASPLVSRIWTLLSAEADADPFARSETTLPDLSAEVQRAWREAHPDEDADAEKRLAAAIERILRYEDPVFALLQKRVLGALRTSIVPAVEKYRARGAPLRLLAGRGRGHRATPSQGSGSAHDDGFAVDVGVVKGFEDDALKAGLKTCATELGSVVRWIIDVWGDEVL